MVSGARGLRVVFFGTPAFAVPTLEALLGSRHTVVAVVTQPDRPRGRGQKMTDAPVKAIASSAGLRTLQPERLKDPAFIADYLALGSDLGVVAAYGKLLPDWLLAAPRLGLINVHGSLLPRYRGAAPVHRAVIAGARETGITIMRVVKALDAGPMLARASRPIGHEETSDVVERELAGIGAGLLVSVVDRLEGGAVAEEPQNEAHATYAPKLKKDEGAIDWSWPSERIHNLVRGLHPWPLAFTFLDGRRYIIRRTAVERADNVGQPGSVIDAAGDRLILATGDGALAVLEIQPEARRPLSPREFLAGHRLPAGTRFGAPP